MSAQVLTQPAVAVKGRSMPPLVVLGLKEAKRILLSPAYLLLLGFFTLTGGIEGIVEVRAGETRLGRRLHPFVVNMVAGESASSWPHEQRSRRERGVSLHMRLCGLQRHCGELHRPAPPCFGLADLEAPGNVLKLPLHNECPGF